MKKDGLPVTSLSGRVAGFVVVVLATFGTWWAFLGPDSEFQRDPVTGISSGPYETTQVVWCVLALIALTVVGAMLLPGFLVVLGVAGSFTVAWSVHAAGRDPTGQWGAGALLLLVGMVIAGVLIVLLVHRVGSEFRRAPTQYGGL